MKITIIENDLTMTLTKDERRYLKEWAKNLLTVHHRDKPVEFGPVSSCFWIVNIDGTINNNGHRIVC